MEQKTNVIAEEGKQEILITRDFDLPVELLFKAYTEPEFIELALRLPFAREGYHGGRGLVARSRDRIGGRRRKAGVQIAFEGRAATVSAVIRRQFQRNAVGIEKKDIDLSRPIML